MAKINIKVIVLCASIPLISSQCTEEKAEPYFRRSVYEFSIDLINRIAEETDNHFVASPLSIWNLISIASIGADGATLKEIKKVLRLHPNKCFNKKFFEIFKSSIESDSSVTLERSSTIFVDKEMPIHEDFQRNVDKTGVSKLKALPFVNFYDVAETINDYVKETTHGAIEEIVDPSNLEGVHLILIDTIFFKALWKTPFLSVETEVGAFYDERGNQIGDANLMFSSNKFLTAYIKHINAKVIELPYGTSERFSMLVFLPAKDGSVSTTIDSLKKISLRSIINSLTKYPAESIQVTLPRFKISSDLDNMKELLEDMGLKTMFDSNQAEFPFISDYILYISNFIQKADVEVTEEGTKASAATEAEFESRSLGDQFIANRPFLFMIVDKTKEMVLFTGAYSKPSLF